MRIALTGATGFIGTCLLREFHNRHSFVAFAPDARKRSLPQFSGVEYVEITCSPDGTCSYDTAQATEALASCDAAVNLGFARPVVGRSDAYGDYVPSVVGCDNFFEACRQAGLANIVHASSRSVYSKTMPTPHIETEPIAPFSFYGAAKAAAEAIAAARNSSGTASIKILRLAQVVGVSEYQGVVHTYLEQARKGQPLEIWGTGDESAREYLYVRDASAAFLAALEHPEAFGVFNIGTGVATTARQLVDGIAAALGPGKVSVLTKPEAKVEAVDYVMDVSKAQRELGWSAQWSMAEMIRAMLEDEEGRY